MTGELTASGVPGFGAPGGLAEIAGDRQRRGRTGLQQSPRAGPLSARFAAVQMLMHPVAAIRPIEASRAAIRNGCSTSTPAVAADQVAQAKSGRRLSLLMGGGEARMVAEGKSGHIHGLPRM